MYRRAHFSIGWEKVISLTIRQRSRSAHSPVTLVVSSHGLSIRVYRRLDWGFGPTRSGEVQCGFVCGFVLGLG